MHSLAVIFHFHPVSHAHVTSVYTSSVYASSCCSYYDLTG